jgi:alkanesulfonate monooxygenase SsuD/methylene tetrahydromethanopterin reductase-like flavin-dependent oxidoreductase (luciferase family)
MGGFVGDAEQVAESIRALSTHGIDRVQLTPYTPATIELLAPHLSASAPAPIGAS